MPGWFRTRYHPSQFYVPAPMRRIEVAYWFKGYLPHKGNGYGFWWKY